MKALLLALLFPPGVIVAMIGVGLCVLPWRPRLALGAIGGALVTLLLCSLPLVSDTLLSSLQQLGPPPTEAGPAQGTAQAIVVLAAGRRIKAPEYGGQTVDALTLERLLHGAGESRRTGLPILVTGGRPGNPDQEPLAALMARTLEEDFGIQVRWMETESVDTAENALLSARILLLQGMRSILLVTHAWHMPRARLAFEAAGFVVVPAATGWVPSPRVTAEALCPQPSALESAYYAAHEWLGLLLYGLTLGR